MMPSIYKTSYILGLPSLFLLVLLRLLLASSFSSPLMGPRGQQLELDQRSNALVFRATLNMQTLAPNTLVSALAVDSLPGARAFLANVEACSLESACANWAPSQKSHRGNRNVTEHYHFFLPVSCLSSAERFPRELLMLSARFLPNVLVLAEGGTPRASASSHWLTSRDPWRRLTVLNQL